MRARIYMKRRNKKFFAWTMLFILVLLVSSAAVFFVTREILYEKLDMDRENLENTMQAITKNIFVSSENIKQGDIIDLSNTTSISTFSSMDQELYVQNLDDKLFAICDIPAGSYIQNCMVKDNIFDTLVRQVEYSDIILSKNLCENDFVDVRLYMPDGTNMVVIAKKNVLFHPNKEDMDFNNLCYFNLSEEEIYNMSCALTLTNSVEDAVLFTTKYIDPMSQEPSKVTRISDYFPIQEGNFVGNLMANTNDSTKLTSSENIEERVELELAKPLDMEAYESFDEYLEDENW